MMVNDKEVFILIIIRFQLHYNNQIILDYLFNHGKDIPIITMDCFG